MRFKNFIWDFDGTLFDTYPHMVAAMQKALPESLRERCATASVGIFCGYCPCSLAKL